jgi:hypothetical protein
VSSLLSVETEKWCSNRVEWRIMDHVHVWVPFMFEFGRFEQNKWQSCSMSESEGMVVVKLVCPDCGESKAMKPPEDLVEPPSSREFSPETLALLSEENGGKEPNAD